MQPSNQAKYKGTGAVDVGSWKAPMKSRGYAAGGEVDPQAWDQKAENERASLALQAGVLEPADIFRQPVQPTRSSKSADAARKRKNRQIVGAAAWHTPVEGE